MNAYVFVSTEVGQAKKVAQKVSKLAGVKVADCCWGRPDVIVFAEVADAKALDGLVLRKIARIAEVEATETHLVLAS
jgi:hypothetical protein